MFRDQMDHPVVCNEEIRSDESTSSIPGLPVEELDEVVAGGAAHHENPSRPADRRHRAAVLHLEGLKLELGRI